MSGVSGSWKDASEQKFMAESITASQKDNTVQVEVVYNLEPVSSTWKAQYTFIGNGAIKVENRLVNKNRNVPVIPGIGVKMQLPLEFANPEYFGRGPWENYCDRNSSTFVGLYKSTVADQYVPYVRPQENGHHTDVRWIALTSDNSNGFLIVADSLIEFNVLKNPVEDFDAGPNKDQNPRHVNDISFRWANHLRILSH